MKITARLLSAIGTMVLLSSPVLAAAGGREDSSNVLVWAFLGICGLIIFLQLVPVLSLTYGLVKGITGGKKEDLDKDLEAVTSKYR